MIIFEAGDEYMGACYIIVFQEDGGETVQSRNFESWSLKPNDLGSSILNLSRPNFNNYKIILILMVTLKWLQSKWHFFINISMSGL